MDASAIGGNMVSGAIAQPSVRRRTVLLAAALALPVLPLLIFHRNGLGILIVGPILMTFVVQGARVWSPGGAGETYRWAAAVAVT